MRKLIVPIVVAAFAFTSCKDVGEAHMQGMMHMRDSIFNHYPTVAAVTINIRDDRLLIITLGSSDLARASETDRRQMATDLGEMAVRLFGKNSGLKKEQLIITPDERNQVAEPTDGVITTISIDSLEKAIPQ